MEGFFMAKEQEKDRNGYGPYTKKEDRLWNQTDAYLGALLTTGLEVTRQQISETVAHRTLAQIFQRSGSDASDQTQQTLSVYSRQGEYVNPASNKSYPIHYQKAVQNIEACTSLLSVEKQEYFAYLVPQLVANLVQDNDTIDQVYDGDFDNIISIAADWFMHPDQVGETHIRVGYGGA